MASVRSDTRKDGTVAHRVFFRHDGRQTCYTFDDPRTAETFRTAVDQLGAASAIALHRVERAPRAEQSVTVTEWVKGHIDHLSGVQADTAAKYRQYLLNDIAPTVGHIPLSELTERDIAMWIKGLQGSAKTVANKQRFLSSALATAIKPGHMAFNVAAGADIPRSKRRQHVYLSREDFTKLLTEIPDVWKPLVEFLVTSGCRWGEATALQPNDVDREECTVRVYQAWKSDRALGPTKTDGSERTVDVPKTVLDKLDYTGKYLFTNPGNGRGGPNAKRNGAGGPVRNQNFARNVWRPACARAKLKRAPRIHDLRHTCASWMIQQGVPLPVIQQHLGHEDIRTTVNVYGHLDRRSARAAADVMAKLLE